MVNAISVPTVIKDYIATAYYLTISIEKLCLDLFEFLIFRPGLKRYLYKKELCNTNKNDMATFHDNFILYIKIVYLL